MERLSEVPVSMTRAIRRRRDLTDGVRYAYLGSLGEPLNWQSIFKRKAEFEQLLQHNVESSSLRLLPTLSRTDSGVNRGRRRKPAQQSRALGLPRSGSALAYAEITPTTWTIPTKANAMDLTCLGITNAIMANQPSSPRKRFSYERLDYIKRNNPNHVMFGGDKNVPSPSQSVTMPDGISSPETKYKQDDVAVEEPGQTSSQEDIEQLREDASQLKTVINNRVSDNDRVSLSREKVSPHLVKPNPQKTKSSGRSKRSTGKSILKRIKEKFEKGPELHSIKEEPPLASVREISFDGIGQVLMTSPRQKSNIQTETKRHKNYRLGGSTKSSKKRAVRFSVCDIVHEYDPL